MSNRVLILGLGQIGMGYDLNLPRESILSHARAFDAHSDFKLVGAVDPDTQKRVLFESHYSLPAFEDISKALLAVQPTIIVVATPTDSHAAAFDEIFSQFKPKIILCEKPLANNLDQAKKIVQLCDENSCQLFVNYFRRSEIGTDEVLKMLKCNFIQTPIEGHAWYTKGLYNSASHLVNLLQLWLGDIVGFEVFKIGRLWNQVDPEPDFLIKFKRGNIRFSGLKDENFFHNSIELIAPNGRLRYEQSGALITWQTASASATFSGYKTLEQNEKTIETDFNRIQWQVVDELSKSIRGLSSRLCTGHNALSTLEICIKIGESK
jgi:predicted dehydrogenase